VHKVWAPPKGNVKKAEVPPKGNLKKVEVPPKASEENQPMTVVEAD
jgi:hypothetical protein